MSISLADIAEILGISKGTACKLRAGVYDRHSDLPRRYARLMEVIRVHQAVDPWISICRSCPRDDCTGCRGQEVYETALK